LNRKSVTCSVADVTAESAHLVTDAEHYGVPDVGEDLLKSVHCTDERDRDRDSIEPKWSAADMKIPTRLEGLGMLSIGKMKEPYACEMAGNAANLPQSELLLGPFFKSRNVCLSVSSTYAGQRGTITVG
jgi:hypothetical protein